MRIRTKEMSLVLLISMLITACNSAEYIDIDGTVTVVGSNNAIEIVDKSNVTSIDYTDDELNKHL